MISELVNLLAQSGLLQSSLLQVFLAFVALAPLLIAMTVFALEARTGFTLRGPGKETIYLPSQFGEVITFIRNMQDLDFERTIAGGKRRRLPSVQASE
jgi:hypothetical protein